MGLFSRKKEEDKKEELKVPVINDGDNWRKCADAGNYMFDHGDIKAAVDFWKEAVDRFDGSDRYFGRMADGIAKRAVDCCVSEARDGTVCPVQLLAGLEEEIEVKLPELAEQVSVVGDTFAGLREQIGKRETCEEVVMMYISACFLKTGYFANTPDIRNVPVGCAEVVQAGREAEDVIPAVGKTQGNRHLSVKQALRSVRMLEQFYTDVSAAVQKALDAKTQQEIDGAVAYWTEHRAERLLHLADGIELSSKTETSRLTRRSVERRRQEAIDLFVDEYFSRRVDARPEEGKRKKSA